MTDKKRITVVGLGAAIAAIGVYGSVTGTATFEVLWLICVGLALAVLYAVRGGSLPDFVYRNNSLTRDDDPRNLSPGLYLSVLIVIILVAVVLFVWTINR